MFWDDKFTYNEIVAFSTVPPGGDGYVLKVADPVGGFETCRAGDLGDEDYSVEAWIYCDYRPELGTGGAGQFERAGLFARDNGNAAFDSTSYGGGNAYVLTWDSDDGRLRAGRAIDGNISDFLETQQVYLSASAWRKFKIDVRGERIRYFIDDEEIANVRDTTFPSGFAGVGLS